MSRRQGFTLIEILIVLGVIAVLGSVVFVAAAPMREASRQTVCMSQLKQIYGALVIYSADWPGLTFPNTEIARVPSPRLIGDMLKDSRVLKCPDWNQNLTGPRLTTYIWRVSADVWTQNDLGTRLFLQELVDKQNRAAALKCFEHERSFYVPRETEIAAPFAQRFEIRLLFNGSVVKGRFERRTPLP